jgi:hypothetical protein
MKLIIYKRKKLQQMIKRIYLLLLVLLFATSGAYAQERTLRIGTVEAGPGSVTVPVEMLNFTNLTGFQISLTYDPAILTPVALDNRFVTGGGSIIWDLQKGNGEAVIYFMDFNMVRHTLNGKAFDLKFQYSGAFPSDIAFNLDNTDIEINYQPANNANFTFINGAVTADPSIKSGTISMDTVDDVILGSIVEMPVYLEGDGFGTVAALNLLIGFNPQQLLYEGVTVMPGVEIAFTVNEDDGELKLAWAGTAQDFTTKTHIANIRFTYNAVAEAEILFLPGTEVSTFAGPLPIDAIDGLVIPRELDAKITVPDVYQYSGIDVAVPVSLSGIDAEFPNAGSITLRLAYDHSIMTYGGYTSPYGDGWIVGTSTDGLVEFSIIDIDGIDLNNGDIIVLNFNFTAPGTSPLTFVDGSSFITPSGAFIPLTFVNGSVMVSVPGNVYGALLDARENSALVLTNPDINEVHATITYPDEFIVLDELDFPVLTDIWKVDADIRSSHAIPAGTVLTLTNNDVTFDYVVENEVAAGEVMYLSDMILSEFPDADARATLLDLAGEVVEWHFDIRSPLTYETTWSVAVITSNDDFVVSEDGDRKGFVLAESEIDIMVYGDPQLLFAFNGELASTGSEFEYCYDVPVTVTLDSKLEGGTSFDITYTVNGEETTLEGVEVGDVIWGPELLEAGTYEVVVTSIVDNFGRDVVDPQDIYVATVVINPMPDADITADGDLEFCDGGAVVLTVSESAEYLWSNGETTQSITVTESGIYTVTVTDDKGCTNTSDEVEVIVNPLPEAVITPDGDLEFCDGGSVVLTASEGASYLWSNDATTQSITVSESGVFSVIVTDAKGCSNTSDEVTVVVNELPVATITVEGELSFCDGGSVLLTSSEAASYLWSNAETTRSITVTESGSYSVTVTDENGCSATSDEVAVTVFELPVVTCRADTVVMLSHEPFDLAGSTPAGGVYSGTGVAAGKFSATTAGVGTHEITYTVTSTDGCVVACTFKIEVKLDTSVPGEAVQSTIKLYPNPARTELYIEANDDIKEIRMVDMLGQVVFTAGVQQSTYELNVSSFKSGIYFVQILTEKGFTTHRVQVTR